MNEVELLRRKLDRERRTREEAESISERVTRELYDRQRALELLEAVAHACNAASSAEQAVQVALDRVCEHTGWPLAHAFVMGADGRMRPTGIWHMGADRYRALRVATENVTFGPGEGLPGRILQSAEPLWIEDVLKDDNFPRARKAADLGVRAAFGFPVLVGDEVVAALEFFADVPLPPDAELLRLMDQVGLHLGRVVERVRNADRLQHQASHDSLTGLPNRALILEHLEVAMARLDRLEGVRHAVLFMDLDGFKEINDTLGHAAGDAVLREVAGRLQRAKRRSDILGRLAGDEFVLICQDLPGNYHAARICERLFRCLAEEFVVAGHRLTISVSVGVAFCDPGGGAAPELVIQQADAAMYKAKAEPGSTFGVYDEDLELSMTHRRSLESALHEAVPNEELFLLYQPEIDLRSGAVAGVEALVRWRRGGRVLLPSEFIPLAEESGAIVPLGAWVVEEACRQAAEWGEAFGDAAPWVSVNLSVRQLMDPATLPAVERAFDLHPGAAGRIYFEVTESVLLEDAERGVTVLADLARLGSEIAIDDFGTGYASLTYLRRFPASAVKIDRSFVAELGVSPAAHAIVASVVDLAHALGLQCVAEGVETRAQLKILEGLRCDIAQGYWFSRAEPADEVERMLGGGTPFATAR